jgi:hypothetical protein
MSTGGNMAIDLNSYQRTNLIIWISILTGVILLTILALALNRWLIFAEYYNSAWLSEIIFITAIGLAFLILFLKRSVFRLDRILEQSSVLTPIARRENYVLDRVRRNYLIIWILSEVFVILGFIYYLFTSDLRNFILFAAVSIFSLATNFPYKEKIRICLENINQPGPSV